MGSIKSSSCARAAIALAVFGGSPNVLATDYVWTAGGTGGAWDAAGNWDLNSGFPSTAGDTATFSAGNTGTNVATTGGVTLPVGNTLVGSITQSGAAAGYRIKGVNGSVLRVDSINNALANTVASPNATSFFSANYTPTAGSIAGTGISAATANGTLTLNSLNLSNGRDTGNVLGGNVGLGNTGTGLTVQTGFWILGGATGAGAGDAVANTYTGPTTVSGGTLSTNKQNGVAAINGAVLVNGGALITNRIGNLGNSTVSVTSGSASFADVGGNNLALSHTFQSLSQSRTGTLPFANGYSLTLTGALNLQNISIGIGQSGNRYHWDVNSAALGGSGGAGHSFSVGGSSDTTNNPRRYTQLTVGAGGLNFNPGSNSSGVANATGTITLNASTGTGAGGRVNLNGNVTVSPGTTARIGSPDTASNFVGFGGLIDLGNATRTFDVPSNPSTSLQIGYNNTANPVNNPSIINGGITKTGLGTMTLGAGNNDAIANAYSGDTTVSAGALVLNKKAGVVAVGGALIVDSNGVLTGSGLVNGPSTISGSVRPSPATGVAGLIGTIRVDNDLTWNAGNAWIFNLGTASADIAAADAAGGGNADLLNLTLADSDFLKGTGNAGGYTFDFANTGGDGVYKLVDWTGTTTFAASDFAATNLPAGKFGSFTVDPTTSALYLTVAVPEPASAAMLALGAAGALRRRRAV